MTDVNAIVKPNVTGASSGPAIRYDAVRLRRGRRLVLDGVTFQVAQGGVVVLMGPSGSGKTTILRTIAGLESFEQGCIDVAGVTLQFEEGLVVGASAERGEDYLQRALHTDAGARRLGEVGIGTNFGIGRAIGATLFDEKIGGTVHLALGRSYPETGGKNESALHWDLICDLRKGGRLTADGEVIQQDGRFT